MMTPVQINNDRYRRCSLSGGDGDHEYGKENTIQPVGPEVFIECNEIQVHAIQYQLDAHQHGNEVSSRKETVNADEEQRCADEENVI